MAQAPTRSPIPARIPTVVPTRIVSSPQVREAQPGLLLEPGATLPTTLPATLPSTLHIGSGKNWKAKYLNLDIEPRWRPDVLFDLNQPLPDSGEVVVASERFGEITFREGMFAEAIAQDVLEHIQDLPTAMTTLLHWMQVGGVLKVAVPYELSLGAWCDPTHVRAFNEQSFNYYTCWSWYLGWRTHHFGLQKQEYIATEYGLELSEKGATIEDLLRTPRAIEQMYVELVKQPLSEEGLRVTDSYFAPRP